MAKRILRPRKLLVASTGVATISYLALGCNTRGLGSTVANLMAAQSMEPTSVVANLPAPPVLTAPSTSTDLPFDPGTSLDASVVSTGLDAAVELDGSANRDAGGLVRDGSIVEDRDR